VFGYLWAIAISITTITTGMHYVIDVAAALPVYFAVRNPDALWERLRGALAAARRRIESGRRTNGRMSNCLVTDFRGMTKR
jgi:hypothetical protein